ncbi:hypothetical protein C1N53_21165 [Pontibacter sp. SGAir0037]|nr:hypothetical protein C1N53_21165 [Pontibacter sp. SGAir0037]
MLKPLAAIAVVSFTMFSCASSNDAMDTTAMNDDTSMSETQTMAGDDQVSSNDTQSAQTESYSSTDVSGGDLSISEMTLTNDEDIDEMFGDIEETEQYDILELVDKSSNLSTFSKLIKAAELEPALQTGGPFTVFAPTNEAFANLPAGELENLLKPENKMELRQVLASHFLAAKVSSAQFNNNQRIGLSDDQEIVIGVANAGTGAGTAAAANNITIGGATIVKPNVEASNGMVHVVDAIIQPTATSTGAGGGMR